MKRRELLKKSAAFGFMAAMPFANAGRLYAKSSTVGALLASDAKPNPLKVPANGKIPVAFLISDGAVVIDFCGPWEVFHNANDAFDLYTVSETRRPVKVSGGMKIIPDYTLGTAPAPRVIVIPAQNAHSPAMLQWIRRSSKQADVTMSVCTGAHLLAETGLLSGKAATTHHSGFKELIVDFPDVQVKRGARFVEDGNLATSAGLSSGIDLALRVVERYYGRDAAVSTAYQLEYQGQGWMDPNSNSAYAKVPVSTDEHPLCAVCDMEVDPKTSLTSAYKATTYRFCSDTHKKQFDANPEKFIAAIGK